MAHCQCVDMGSTPIRIACIAGLTSGLRRQFHKLIFVGSNPTPATFIEGLVDGIPAFL